MILTTFQQFALVKLKDLVNISQTNILSKLDIRDVKKIKLLNNVRKKSNKKTVVQEKRQIHEKIKENIHFIDRVGHSNRI